MSIITFTSSAYSYYITNKNRGLNLPILKNNFKNKNNLNNKLLK